MKRKDELDRKHARLFAWRKVTPGDTVDFPAPDEPLPTAGSASPVAPPPAAVDVGIPVNADVDIDEALEKTRPECAAIEREVAQAWLLSGEEQLKATRAILRRVATVGVALIGLGKHASIRLARLVTRHYRRLSNTHRSDCGYIFGLNLSHPESADLVVEAVLDRNIVDLLTCDGDRSERPSWASPACVARLAPLVDGSAKTALAALELISHCAPGDACPVLRRVLRTPEWTLRARAANYLLTLAELDADDCSILLHAATLPRPRRLTRALAEALGICEGTLRQALPGLRPAGGEEALLRILSDDKLAFSPWLGASWALDSLAVAYPICALDPIDRRLRSEFVFERVTAVSAAASLPVAEAQARLTFAAGDPAGAVADHARSAYYQRFGSRCPAPELAGVATELLVAPPSENFLGRLGVLRVVSGTTRAAWARTLLGEAPSPESLALLVFVLGAEDGPNLCPPLPLGAAAWSHELLNRFGASAVPALCALGARFPVSRGRGWVAVLGDRIEDGSITEASRYGVRVFAEGLLGRPWANEEDVRRLIALAR